MLGKKEYTVDINVNQNINFAYDENLEKYLEYMKDELSSIQDKMNLENALYVMSGYINTVLNVIQTVNIYGDGDNDAEYYHYPTDIKFFNNKRSSAFIDYAKIAFNTTVDDFLKPNGIFDRYEILKNLDMDNTDDVIDEAIDKYKASSIVISDEETGKGDIILPVIETIIDNAMKNSSDKHNTSMIFLALSYLCFNFYDDLYKLYSATDQEEEAYGILMLDIFMLLLTALSK